MFCKNCGSEIDDKAVICPKCGVAVVELAKPQSAADSVGVRLLIPIGRSGLAIAAGYVAFFSVFPFIGILSLLLGILALIDISKHPKKHGRGRAIFAIIAGVISSVIYFKTLYMGMILSIFAN